MMRMIRDSEAFLAEWREAARSVSPRDGRILEDVALRGRRLARVGKEHGLSKERVRQIADQSVGLLRNAARRNPRGELGRALSGVGELMETAAIETWSVRRMARRGKDEVAGMLVRLDAVAADQAWLAPALCFLAERPPEPRASLGPMAKDARDLLLVHPRGLSPGSLRRRLRGWREPMSTWPHLDMGAFVAARMAVVTAPDGRMRLAGDAGDAPLPRRATAQRLELALRRAGCCLHYAELAERVSRQASGADRRAPRTNVLKAPTVRGILSQDPRFRWTGRGTYGLAEWDVGLTVPHRAMGRRPSVSMEIEHLLRQRDSIAMAELMEHLNRRLRVRATTIHVRARQAPGTEILDNTLYRVGSADHRRAGGQWPAQR